MLVPAAYPCCNRRPRNRPEGDARLDKGADASESPSDRPFETVRRTDISGNDMKAAASLIAISVALGCLAGTAQATVRIADDRGGRIGIYVDKYQGLRASGEAVVIDGLCASACTIVLGAVDRSKICVTDQAKLGFHAAYDIDDDGRKVTNPEATRMLFAMYPDKVRRWISSRGGLTPTMMFLRGAQLAGMFRHCGGETRQAARPVQPPHDDRNAGASASAKPAAAAVSRASWSGRGLGDLFSGLDR